MNTNPYKVNSITAMQYEFESVGSKGTIKKGVEISPLEIPGYYNFGFGDVNKDSSMDDEAETNNGDLLNSTKKKDPSPLKRRRLKVPLSRKKLIAQITY
ncbi:DUF6934 family protein [Chitinophaga ginsengisoli]|uniref:Uncharacterized protein n=1 Tax=Chitinophaga ginsengisoli TaxID=363837 RepID=A0A2P8GQD0_9BACT|nr:hypothetical protein [Chitinophaga ginsengisoli]PSL36179.1 hypothetical protein CLV42_101948 [Chitinophaga ginsengisoli]